MYSILLAYFKQITPYYTRLRIGLVLIAVLLCCSQPTLAETVTSKTAYYTCDGDRAVSALAAMLVRFEGAAGAIAVLASFLLALSTFFHAAMKKSRTLYKCAAGFIVFSVVLLGLRSMGELFVNTQDVALK